MYLFMYDILGLVLDAKLMAEYTDPLINLS